MPKEKKLTTLERQPPKKNIPVKTSEDPGDEFQRSTDPETITQHGPHPAWDLLNWKPVKKLPNSFNGNTGVTIMLPFRGVDLEDLPEIVECFGGPFKIVAATKHPQDKSKKLSFNMHQSDSVSPIMGVQPNKLGTIAPTNSFILQLNLCAPLESDEAKQARAKKELSSVQRALATPVRPLPPMITNVSFLFPIKTVFDFDKLYDFGMCPAIPTDRTSVKPEHVQMNSIVPYLLPSYPTLTPPGDPVDYLYFPALRFTHQTGYAGHEFIPSLYTDSIASHEKSVIRVRKAHAQSVKWSNGGLQIPGAADAAAWQTLLEKVPEDIRHKAQQMLDERAIWPRKEFYSELCKAKPELLMEHKRFVLAGLAYRFSNGPWTRSWCRFGYDPTKDPETRKFQVIDYRINQALLRTKRTITKKHVPSDRGNIVRKLVSKITGAVSPGSAKGIQFMVLIKDLMEIAEIRDILQSPSRIQSVCDAREGFFTAGTMEFLRLELSKAIYREDPALVSNPAIIRQFQNFGMFKDVVLPLQLENDSDDEDGEAKMADETLTSLPEDVDMEDLTNPLSISGEDFTLSAED